MSRAEQGDASLVASITLKEAAHALALCRKRLAEHPPAKALARKIRRVARGGTFSAPDDRDQRVLEGIRIIFCAHDIEAGAQKALTERVGRVVQRVLFPDGRVVAAVECTAAVRNFNDEVAAGRQQAQQRLDELQG